MHTVKKKGTEKRQEQAHVQHDEAESEESESESNGLDSESQFAQLGFLNGTKYQQLKKLILLDNQSTMDLFCHSGLLSNIRQVYKQMTVIIQLSEQIRQTSETFTRQEP